MELRDYQAELKGRVTAQWQSGARNVLAVMPTGAGKTVLFSAVLQELRRPAVAIAHRREILGQISLALSRCEVPHQIIGPRSAARQFAAQQREELGRSWIDPGALVSVASVDTLQARPEAFADWGRQVALWVQDEAHHLLSSNKWGKATELFPNALGLGVTATPERSDRKALGRSGGGVFDALESGPSMRELIERGYLTDYRVFVPPSDLTGEGIKVTSSGDYSKKELVAAAHGSHIVGDVVGHYRKLASGKRGVTFVTDVETAQAIAAQYRAAGVPAAALDATTPDAERAAAVRDLRRGRLLQLVNVDLFGEGFDLPAIEVVTFARPTASYGLYCQQFGRALRPLEGKERALIIDHAHNVRRHGLPDRPATWALGSGAERKSNVEAPLKTCQACLHLWQGYDRTCPLCGFVPERAPRKAPAEVEGDLHELDPATLAAMRREVDRVNEPPREVSARMLAAGAPEIAAAGAAKNHRLRQEAQVALRGAMSLWGGAAKARGLGDSARFVAFYRTFGIDVLTAQTLGRRQAEELTERIKESLG
jgi:superfamily II DNA or RNA helicase